MSLSQNDSGRALEYGLAISFSQLLPATTIDNLAIRKAKECFKVVSNNEKQNIVAATKEIALFLIAHDKRFLIPIAMC